MPDIWKAYWPFKARNQILLVLLKDFSKLALVVSPHLPCLLLRLFLCSADIGQFVIVALPSIYGPLEIICHFRYTWYFNNLLQQLYRVVHLLLMTKSNSGYGPRSP